MNMSEEYLLQSLNLKDRVSVILYRAGILLSALLMLCTSIFMLSYEPESWGSGISGLLLLLLYVFTGLSVFNIHLYMGSLRRFLRGMYLFSLGLLLILIFLGAGNPALPLFKMPMSGLLLLPLGGAIAFIGAKEAYCFNLIEGYILGLLLPLYILLWSMTSNDLKVYGLIASSVLMLFLGLRKAVMPLSFDIGDKSKYIP